MLLDGADLLAMPSREAARRIAVVAQETTVEFDFTVLEMVMIGRTPHKRAFERDDETDRAIVADAIERVGCEELAHRSFNTLSGGEKQRVLVARAIAQGADHLILDEPTNHLDIRYQIEVLELVAGFGMTVLAALHDLSLAALFCDAVCLLADGGRGHERSAPGGDHRRAGAPRLRRRRPDRRAPRDRDPAPHPPPKPAQIRRLTEHERVPGCRPAFPVSTPPPRGLPAARSAGVLLAAGGALAGPRRARRRPPSARRPTTR